MECKECIHFDRKLATIKKLKLDLGTKYVPGLGKCNHPIAGWKAEDGFIKHREIVHRGANDCLIGLRHNWLEDLTKCPDCNTLQHKAMHEGSHCVNPDCYTEVIMHGGKLIWYNENWDFDD